MATKDCVNGHMKVSKYSSPLPIIGLYITAATWGCLLFMIFDIISAFRKRQRWIPCRLFSLNSVTLTLLAIISKLQLDLTTAMPSLQDQLSKLTGSILLCILIGFLSPSIGKTTTSESLTNMASLTILVINVIVDIFIQIRTRAIFLFVVEHIIISCCLLIFLVLLWSSALDWSSLKNVLHDRNQKLITKEGGTLLERLKLCYIYGFGSDSQLRLSRDIYNITLFGFCLMCLGILVQALFRSLILPQFKFCKGVSDYKWSVWIILISQILAVIVGCFASSFRGVTSFTRVQIKNPSSEHGEADTLIRTNPMLGARILDMCRIYLIVVLDYMSLILLALFYISAWPLFCFRSLLLHKDHDEEAVRDYRHLIGEGAMDLDEWTVWKAVTDMNNSWLKVSKMSAPIYLTQLLSRTNPSPQLQTMELKGLVYPIENGIKVSPLSMALLVKLAAFAIPGDRTKDLQSAFSKVHEIIDFVHTRINDATLENVLKSKLAKAVMLGDGFSVFYPKGIALHGYEISLDRALELIKGLTDTMPDDYVSKNVCAIVNLIESRQYGTIEDLCNYLEQIFVDMLHLFLAQVPNVVFKYVNESPAEEFEERVRFSFISICKIESLGARVYGSFPGGSNILGLITSPAPEDQTRSTTSPRAVNAASSTHSTDNVLSSQNDVIVPM